MKKCPVLSIPVILILPILLSSEVPAQTFEERNWVIACGVFQNRSDADALVEELEPLIYSDAGVLWIPDWQTLSGFEGWLVYLGPFADRTTASGEACHILWKLPDVYAVRVASSGDRDSAIPEARFFRDLLGLTPPSPGYFYYSEDPENMQIEMTYPDVGEVNEWQQPVVVNCRIPGWEIEKWVDLYIGTVESRILRTPGETQTSKSIYQRDSEFLKNSISSIQNRIFIFENPGEFTLLHMYPDPEARTGDCDLWIAVTEEGVEYGFRVRTFYGDMMPSWESIPRSAHENSAIPVLIETSSEARGFLIAALTRDRVFSKYFPENISFSETYLDLLPEAVYRDYYDFTLREVHNSEFGGDPNTAPVVGRFRIYNRGEIIVLHPVMGVFVPYADYISR